MHRKDSFYTSDVLIEDISIQQDKSIQFVGEQVYECIYQVYSIYQVHTMFKLSRVSRCDTKTDNDSRLASAELAHKAGQRFMFDRNSI